MMSTRTHGTGARLSTSERYWALWQPPMSDHEHVLALVPEEYRRQERESKSRLAPLMSSARGDWQTPDCVLERVRCVAPIGLDPCTAPSNPTRAAGYYTPLSNGLTQPWDGVGNDLIYCNPPYGRGIGAWVDKCREAAAAGETVIALLPARTDTRWFPWDADALCFWSGRLTFKGAPAPAPFPSVLAFWGSDTVPFKLAFRDAGPVVYPDGVLL